MAGPSVESVYQLLSGSFLSGSILPLKNTQNWKCDNQGPLVLVISLSSPRQVNSSSVGYHVESSPEWTHPGANLSFKGLASILCRKNRSSGQELQSVLSDSKTMTLSHWCH